MQSLEFVPLPVPLSPKVLRAFRADAGSNEDDEAALAGAHRPGSRIQWVTARAGQKTVAIARLELAPPQFAFVSELIVLGAWRRRGVGDRFMRDIEAYCVGQGIPRILLRPLGASRGFYARLCFVDDPLVPGFLRKDLPVLRRRFQGTMTSTR